MYASTASTTPSFDDHFERTTAATSGSAAAAMRSALSRPPNQSTPRDHTLLTLATECGPGGQALALLEQIDVSQLDAHDRVDFLRAVTAQSAWLEALQTIALSAVCGPTIGWPEEEVNSAVAAELDDLRLTDASGPERIHLESMARSDAWETRERAIALEVSLATRVSTRTAGRRVESARFLVEQIPQAVTQAWAGRWGYGHLRVAEKELMEVSPEVRSQVLDEVVAYAATDHPRRLTDRMRKSIARHDADGMAERGREKSAKRDVDMWTLSDGQSRLAITGPHELIASIHREITEVARARKAALDARADTVPEEDRRIGAVRVDTVREGIHRLIQTLREPDAIHNPPTDRAGNLADAIHNAPTDHAGNLADAIHSDAWLTGTAPSGPGTRPRAEAAVIVDLATALGMADQPGYLPGYGWIPPSLAREILADSTTWRRWLIDDTSRQLMEVGKTRYRPSQALRDLVTARDLTCTADTCTRPASASQLDHAIDFDGANTTPGNVHAACGPDHLAVTAGYFVIADEPDGTITWTSTTTDQTYPSHPHPLYDEPASTGRPADHAIEAPPPASSDDPDRAA